jgi:hypothetical protein
VIRQARYSGVARLPVFATTFHWFRSRTIRILYYSMVASGASQGRRDPIGSRQNDRPQHNYSDDQISRAMGTLSRELFRWRAHVQGRTHVAVREYCVAVQGAHVEETVSSFICRPSSHWPPSSQWELIRVLRAPKFVRQAPNLVAPPPRKEGEIKCIMEWFKSGFYVPCSGADSRPNLYYSRIASRSPIHSEIHLMALIILARWFDPATLNFLGTQQNRTRI